MSDLTEALKKLRKYFAEGFDEKVFDTYVPPKGNKQGEVVSIQETLIEDVAKTKERLFVVLGDSGLGKTTLGLRLSKTQWKIYEEVPEARIPLFIHLPKIKAKYLRQDLLYDYLKRLVKLSKEERQSILTKPLLLILDGFDELKIEDRQNLFESNDWGDKRYDIKVVITCRPEALVGKNQQVYFEVKSLVLQGGAGQLSYQLELFTEKEIYAYIEQFVEQKKKAETQLELDWLYPKTYHEWLERLTSLKSLIQNPFLLTLVIEVLPELVKKYDNRKLKTFEQIHYTRNDIFKAFTEKWFAEQALRLQKDSYLTDLPIEHLVGYLLAYAQNLAASLLQEGKLELILSDQETLEEHLAEPTHDINLLKDYEQRKEKKGCFSKKKLKSTLKDLRSGCLLKTQAETFQFLHKSLIEYFAAKELFEGLQGEWDFYFKEALKDESEKNRGMNREYLNNEPEILDMLADRAKEDEDFRGLLCDLVMQSKMMPGIEIASANAMTILNRARISFSGLDFSEVQIPKANLTQALCYNTNFRGANAKDISLHQAWLLGSLWQGASLEGIQFGERAFIETKAQVYSVVFYKDEENHDWILVGCSDGCVYRYSFETGKPHPHGYYNHDYRSGRNDSLFIATSSSMHRLAVGGGSKKFSISLWDLQSGKKVQELKGHTNSVLSVAFSPDSQCLASAGGYDKTIHLWQMPEWKEGRVLEGHTGWVLCVAFSPDGQWLASGSNDKTIRLWQMPEGKEYRVLEGHSGSVWSVAFSPDCQWLASASIDKTIRLWRMLGEKVERVLKGHTNSVNSVTFSLDSQCLVSGSSDTTLHVWQMPEGKEYRVLQGHASSVNSVTFSPDSQWLTSGSVDKTLRLWQIPKGKVDLRSEKEYAEFWSGALSPDGQWLVFESSDNTLRLWKMPEGKEYRLLKEHTGSVWSVAFSPDNQWLASGSGDNTLRLWRMPKGKKCRVLSGHTYGVSSVAFSPDGQWLASGSNDKTIRLWQMPEGKEYRVLEGHTDTVWSVAFSPDSQWLASGSSDLTIRLWRMPEGKACRVLKEEFLARGNRFVPPFHIMVIAPIVAFSPDGQWLASRGLDKTILLWYMPEGNGYRVRKGHTDFVNSMSFSPDSQWLASGSSDKTIRVWSMKTFQCSQIVPLWFEVKSFSYTLKNQQWVAGGENGHLVVGIWNSNGQLSMTWTQKSWPSLELSGTDFTHAQGLSESQQQLLIQRKATVVAPPKTQIYRPLHSLFKPLPGTASHKTHYALVRMAGTKLSCSEELWVVSVARKTSGTSENKQSFSFLKTQNSSLHGFLIIEGVQNHRRFIIRADLTTPGSGKVAIDIKALDDFEKFQESVQYYEANQWQITRNEGMKLIQNIREDQGKVLNYSQWGGKSIFTIFSSKQTMSTEVYNCLTWCREQLKKINIIIPESGREWLFVLPEDVIKQPIVKLN